MQLRDALRRWLRVVRVRMVRMTPGLGRAAAVLVAMSMLTGCVQQLDLSSTAKGVAPLPSIPASVGDYTIERTPVGDKQFEQFRDVALIRDYGFYVVRQDTVAVGTLQTASFKAGLRSDNHKVREGVLTSLGGTPVVTKVAGQLFYTVTINDLRLVVWFPKEGLTYQLLSATKDLTNPTDFFARLLAVEQGEAESSVNTQQGAPPADVRRNAP